MNTEGRVEIYVDRTDSNDDPNVLISVNGKNYLIPKGQSVFVPPEVAAEYRRSQAAKEKFYKLVEARTQQS
jgi:hypothetical protein